MSRNWIVPQVDEDGLCRLAERIALKLRAGDTLSLSGDLGAGKTTFARALIRAVLDDADAEVPSPTFSLVQTYASERLSLAHADLYRISHEDEIEELGLDEARASGALIVEWAERAPSLLGADRLEIRLGEGDDSAHRSVKLVAHGTWEQRLVRLEEMSRFLDAEPFWRTARLRYLQGDASARAYAKLIAPIGAQVEAGTADAPSIALLMDWPRQPDGPPIRDGLPYSRIAHLAEDVSAFVAIDGLLRRNGFHAPAILATDLDHGFLILEHLGDRVFGKEIARGTGMSTLWQAATDVLIELRRLRGPGIRSVPVDGGGEHEIPTYDKSALTIETELVLDWYWPLSKGAVPSAAARTAFASLWAPLLDHVLDAEPRLVLRDYHSPNLIWCPERGTGPLGRVGLIDFQDAVLGHPAYDLVSLLQDARLDVPAEIEAHLLDHYCARAGAAEPGFDAADFKLAYAILGAQRNTKILGIFARLARRDGKLQYLAHIPRIWRYLERSLSHPELAALRAWYGEAFPHPARAVPPQV